MKKLISLILIITLTLNSANFKIYAENSDSQTVENNKTDENNETLETSSENMVTQQQMVDYEKLFAINMEKWKDIYEKDQNNSLMRSGSNENLIEHPDLINGNTNIEINKAEEIESADSNSTQNSTYIYKLEPKYMITNFTFDTISSTVTKNDSNFSNLGAFRTQNDLVGMSWKTLDELGHKDFRYTEDNNFEGVKLRYEYNISGYTTLMDAAICPTLTVRTNSGGEYFVRLWNYTINRPGRCS
ncbi:MAG: hypothetical protein WCD89_04590 [Anaerocolumna sp.]